MRIDRIVECSSKEFLSLSSDMLICASGYEKRSTYIAKYMAKSKPLPSTKVALGFSANQSVGERRRNDERYKAFDFEMITCGGNEADPIRDLVRHHVLQAERELTIVMDITSMTRYWYATLLDEMRRAKGKNKISILFTYVPSSYEKPPKQQPPNKSIGPLPGFAPMELPSLPAAVIVGLGHEPGKALGVIEYIDPDAIFAFMTDPAYDKRFTKDVQTMNRLLLNRLGSNHVIRYPLASISEMGLLLKSVAEGLLGSYRLILVPLGPKPFSLLCILFAILHPEVSVWRVSSEEEEFLAERRPLKTPLVCRVDFCPDNGVV